MLVSYGEREAKLYSKLYVSRMDIGFARACADFLLKKGWHAQPWERRGTIYLQQAAFTSALITAYARPFTRSKGWPALPADLRSSYEGQESVLHEKLIELRHTIYAHSDSVSYSIRPWRFGDIATDLVMSPAMRITAEETTRFLAMSTKLITSIAHRIEELKKLRGDSGKGDDPSP